MTLLLRITPFLFFALIFIAFLAPASEDGSDFFLQRYFTVFALILLAFRFDSVLKLVSKTLEYWLYLFFVVVSVIWAHDMGQLFGLMRYMLAVAAAGLCAAIGFAGEEKKLFRWLTLFFSGILAASIVAVYAHPDTAIALNGRWLGITKHWNSLGAAAMLAVWAALANWLYHPTNFDKLASITAIALAIVALIGSDSKTPLLATVFAGGIIIPTLRFQSIRSTFLAFGVFGFIGLVIVLALISVGMFAESSSAALNSVGRESDFSGRTLLWGIGVQSFFESPIIGWGFDHLDLLTAKHRVHLSHLHNAYLDIAVRGGIVGLLLFGSVILTLFLRISATAVNNVRLSLLLLWIIAILLIHAMGEGGLGKGMNAQWLTFSIVYFLVAANGSLLPFTSSANEHSAHT